MESRGRLHYHYSIESKEKELSVEIKASHTSQQALSSYHT